MFTGHGANPIRELLINHPDSNSNTHADDSGQRSAMEEHVHYTMLPMQYGTAAGHMDVNELSSSSSSSSSSSKA